MEKPVTSKDVVQWLQAQDTSRQMQSKKVLRRMQNTLDVKRSKVKYQKAQRSSWNTKQIQVGDKVRLLEHFNVFDKRSQAKYTKKVYVVSRIEANTFYYVTLPDGSTDAECMVSTTEVRNGVGEPALVPKRFRKYELLKITGDASSEAPAGASASEVRNLSEDRRENMAQHAIARLHRELDPHPAMLNLQPANPRRRPRAYAPAATASLPQSKRARSSAVAAT
jgi:hypothetical protein